MLLIPLIYLVPLLGIVSNQAYAVYMAEPIADVIAVTFAALLFRIQFRKAMEKLENPEQSPAVSP